MIYISTGGFNKKSVIEVIQLLSKNNIKAFELSGGIFTDNLESKLKILSNKFEFVVHNYFPPPKKPFREII